MKREGTPVLVLNAGNLFFKREQLKPNQTEASRLTADLILASCNLMGFDALSVGAYDLSLGVDYLIQKRGEAAFPFLSANLYDRHGTLLFTPYVLKGVGAFRVGVFGLIDDTLKMDKIPSSHKIVLTDPFRAAPKVVAELKAKGADLIVLLTDMTSRSQRRMAQLGLPIDLIVGSDERNQISLPIVVHGTYLTHLDRGGKSLGRLDITLPVAGDGAQPSPATLGKRLGELVYRNNFIQLRLSLPDHPVVAPMVEEVNRRVSAAQRETITSAEAGGDGDCGKRYMGVQTCVKCHPGRHATWLASGHARAYQALVAKQKQYDEECIVCHALAYQCDQQSLDLKTVDAFANVQCESCHGPGDLHVRSRGEQSMVVERGPVPGCLRCHTPEKSGDSGFLTRFADICSDKPQGSNPRQPVQEGASRRPAGEGR